MDNDTERNAELYTPEDERIFDENCLLHGTPHCRLLNMESCNSCYIRNLSEKDQRKAMEDIRMAAAAMPVGGMESLRQDDECAFCRGMKNPADGGYALFDIGHLNPKAIDERKNGRKAYKRDVSIVVPVQLPVCRHCKRRIQLINYLPLVIGLIIAALSFFIVISKPVYGALNKQGRIIPVLAALIGVLLAVAIANLVKMILKNTGERKTVLRPGTLKPIEKLRSEGWFVIESGEFDIPLTFSKEGLKNGIMTGGDQENNINEIVNWNGVRSIGKYKKGEDK